MNLDAVRRLLRPMSDDEFAALLREHVLDGGPEGPEADAELAGLLAKIRPKTATRWRSTMALPLLPSAGSQKTARRWRARMLSLARMACPWPTERRLTDTCRGRVCALKSPGWRLALRSCAMSPAGDTRARGAGLLP